MSLTFFLKNTELITFPGLKDTTTGLFVSDATVTATLFHSDGVTVADPSLENIPLNPVSGTPGTYQASIPQSVNIPTGSYLLAITAIWNGSQFFEEYPVSVKVNKSS